MSTRRATLSSEHGVELLQHDLLHLDDDDALVLVELLVQVVDRELCKGEGEGEGEGSAGLGATRESRAGLGGEVTHR